MESAHILEYLLEASKYGLYKKIPIKVHLHKPRKPLDGNDLR